VEQGRCGLRGELAVAEPLLEDLVSAEGVIPDMDGDGGPVGVAVEMDIDAGFAEKTLPCPRIGTWGTRSLLGGGESGEFLALGSGPGAFGSLAATGGSRPLSVRLVVGRNQVKEYVLIVTKQGGLVLNKKIEGSSQN
jgi:hypothetical protein